MMVESPQTIKSKKKKFTWFVGLDIGKHKIDFAVFRGEQFVLHKAIDNQTEAITAFCDELKKLKGFKMANAIFCMEESGIYCMTPLNTLYRLKAFVVIENALKIKRSLGIVRGKDDKKDAGQIAVYARKNVSELKPWQPKRAVVCELQYLMVLRDRLINTHQILHTPFKEAMHLRDDKLHLKVAGLSENSIAVLSEDIKILDAAIRLLMRSDERLKRLSEIITSVKGVGVYTAAALIVCTNEFVNFHCPRKFASYAGIAPFKNESGRMIKRARTSPIANKKMKALLHMCAVSALRFDDELKEYYKRKTEVQGKPKMSAMNAVKYKLVLRVFACVRQDRLFESDFIWKRTAPVAEISGQNCETNLQRVQIADLLT
ncbi:MAG: IS110 family transposase [Bacteroidetes bacterium]|nr:IS110 family transposase [Bacteroidota bacterium]